MPSIDERVVSMAFENAVFEQRIAQTMTSLGKLNDAIAKTGSGPNGMANIEKEANKVTLNAPMSALDKLKAKFGRTGTDAAEGFSEVERASNKVTLEGTGKAIDKTQAKLNQLSAGDTFSEIERGAGKVSLQGLTSALDNVTAKFSVLQGAAAVALGNITSQAVQRGTAFAKGFGVGPILDGLHEYETNLKSIQTIQANTDRPLTEINRSLQELNKYSDQTIYNFSEMARNIGTFTAAGVDLKTATSSIKGIANMAALSGSNSQQAATAMYQLSQAISSGRVGLQDWNSVVNAGMGGKKLQNALAQTSIAMGGMKDSAVKLEGPMKKLTINGQSFRESIQAKPGQKPWLTSEVLVNTLATLDGRFSKAALSAELTTDGLKKYTAAQIEAKIADNRAALEKKNGVKYTDEQFKALQQLSDSAFKSATEVKTLGQVFDVAKETIGSGWSASFQSIFGNLKEAKKTFTELSGTINGFINANALARNTVLHDWKKLGGRTDMIEGLKNVFGSIIKVLGTVKDAFREIFPAKTGKDLFQMTEAFLNFSKSMIPSKDTLEDLKRTFAGAFAVMHIGFSIVKGLAGVIFDLLGVVGKGSGGFLNFTGSVGDFLVSIDTALTKGGLLRGFFNGLTNILRAPIEVIQNLAAALGGMFGGLDGNDVKKISTVTGKAVEVLTPFEKLTMRIKNAWEQLGHVFGQVADFLSPVFDKIKEAFSTVTDAIAEGLRTANMDKVLLAFQTTILGGIFLTLKRALSGGKGGIDLTGGVLGQVKGILGDVSNQLQAMQKNVQATAILKIGAAVAVLAAGVYVLSTIDPKALARAMTAVAVGLAEMGGALKLMIGSKGAMAAMPVIATSILILAGAMLVLSAAVKIFSTMSWDELARGLTGVAGTLTGIGLAMKTIGATRIIPIAAGLVLVGVALNLIAVATKMFASLKWEELAKGIVGLAGSMAVLAAGLALIGPSVILVGPGLIAASFGMTILAAAVASFGAIDPKRMLSGILGLGLALSALATALWLMPPTAVLTGAGLVVAATGITILAGALGIFGKLKIETIVKGLVAMGAALVELAVGLTLMAGTLPGSLALMGAAAAFAVLGPALAFMGVLPWGVILKGLAAMALSMGVIAVVGLIAAPALLAMGGALVVLGAGLSLIAGAIYIAAKGLSLLGENGAKGIGTLVAAITAFIALLPTMVINFVKGLVSIIEGIAEVAPKVALALGVIIDTVLSVIIEQAPKLAMAAGSLIDAFLEVIITRSPQIIAAGMNLLVNFLSGVSSNIATVTTKVGEIITRFLGALQTQLPRIIQQGAKTLGAFLGGIATALPQMLASAAKVVGKFLEGITKQLPGVITKGAKMVLTFLAEITKRVPDFVKAGARLIVAVINGIGDQLVNVIKAGSRLISKFMNGMAEEIPKLADQGAKAVIKFLNGLAKAIRDNDDALAEAGGNLASAMIEGIATGLSKLDDVAIDAAKKLAAKLPHWVKKVLGIKSPSTVFAEIGKQSAQGLVDGLNGSHGLATDGAKDLGNGVIGAFKDVFQIQSPSKVLKEIGKEVGHGFRDGLDGSAQDIRNSFRGLREKLNQEMATARENIKQEKDKLADLQKQYADKMKEIADLRSQRKPDKDAIKSALEEAKELRGAINISIDAIQGYKGTLEALKATKGDLVGDLQDEKNQLVALSKDFDDVSKYLDAATQALQNAKQERDNAIKSYTDQFNQLPDWDSLLSEAMAEADMTYEELAEKRQKEREEREKKSRIDQVALYKKALQEQIIATQKYEETLQALRAAGLDDATYKKLLAQGLSGQDFASQLLAQGKAGIEQINKMDAELLKTSTSLAEQAAKNLYQAGIDAAQGLVDGLTKKKADIQKAMDVIADAVVARIKSALGIRSPSTVFAEVGKFATEGLAKGLTDNSKSVANAAGAVGETAAEAMTGSLSNLSDKVGAEIDTDITVTPVLDLSQVKKEAKNMPEFAGPSVAPVVAPRSFAVASATSGETAAVSHSSAGEAMFSRVVNFEQNNYSPKALSDIEVYRRTNNQLGNIKRALGVSA